VKRILIAAAIAVLCLAPARAAGTIPNVTVHRTTILDTDLLIFEAMSQPSGQRTSNIFASDLAAYFATKGIGSSIVNGSTAALGFTNGQCLIANGNVIGSQACGGGGGVTSITTTAPLTGGPITGTGAIACATCATLNTQDQTLSGGANITPNPLGTASGTMTIDAGKSPAQTLTNNGAFTLAAPANDGQTIVAITNGASAGAISFSGFTVGSNTGDTLTTTNGNKFWIWVARIGGTSSYFVKALQ
jgi:hypothetical protein